MGWLLGEWRRLRPYFALLDLRRSAGDAHRVGRSCLRLQLRRVVLYQRTDEDDGAAARREAAPVIPSEEIDDYRFRLPERTRREIFAEIAAAETAERKRAMTRTRGRATSGRVRTIAVTTSAWQLRALGAALQASASRRCTSILDEGFREHWPGPDGKPLPATTPPLDIAVGHMVKDPLALTKRWTDRIASMTALRLIVWVAIAALVYQGILSDPFKLADWMDDHQFYAWEESDRMTLLRWGQLPAWNPYWCGGTVGHRGARGLRSSPPTSCCGSSSASRTGGVSRSCSSWSSGSRACTACAVASTARSWARRSRRSSSATCDRFVSFIHDGWINFLGFELHPLGGPRFAS